MIDPLVHRPEVLTRDVSAAKNAIEHFLTENRIIPS